MTHNTDLTVLILAAGQGTRMLSPLPKVLHPIAGKPLLNHCIDTAAALNPARICVVTNPKMPDVAAASAPHIVAYQDVARGTGHAVACGLAALPTDLDGHVLVLYGDVPLVSGETLQGFIDFHRNGNFGASVLAFAPPNPTGYGRIFQNPDGTLAQIVEEKDATADQKLVRLCNSGLMIMRATGLRDRLARLSPKNAAGELYLTDIPALLREDNISCGVIRGEFNALRGVNDRAQLAELEMAWQHGRRLTLMRAGVTLQDPNTAIFHHDTVVGTDVTIGANVVCGPGVVVGDGAQILPFCYLEHTTIAPGAVVAPFTNSKR